MKENREIKRHTVSSSRPDTRQKLKWQTMVVSRRTRRLVSTPDSRSALDWMAGVSEMGSPAVTRCPSPQSPEAAASSHRCRTKNERRNANTQWTNASCLFPFAVDGGDTVCTLLSLYCTYTQDRTDAGTTTTLQITTQHSTDNKPHTD